MEVLYGHLPDTQAGFRLARGCRNNVCALRWFIAMVLREGRNAVISFIDYSAAFDTESQIFLDGALADAGVSAKVRRIIQAFFTAATGIVRVRLPSEVNVMSESFNIERGVLPCLVHCWPGQNLQDAHNVANSGVVVGNGDSSVIMSKFEYADDAALIDGNTTLASARVTALAEGSLEDAAMVITVRKSKAMHVHRIMRVDATMEEDVAALTLVHKCESCGREFSTGCPVQYLRDRPTPTRE